MGTGGRVAAAVATGYLLGRTKKLKLAITVGSMMAGKRLATNPRGMLRQASEFVDSNEQLAPLADQVRGNLLEAGRGAAVSVASNRLEAFSDSLRERSDQWREIPSSDDEEERDDEPEAEAEAEDERDTDEDAEPEAEEESPPAAPKKQAKSSSAKKTSSKSSAKKPTSKSSSTKSASTTSSSKKSTTKKAPANKSAPTKQSSSKKSTSGRSRSSKARS